ncbi:MAG: ABC transporter ATP-binding protein [Candidatus Thorarchaeota archaeon]
MTIYAVELEGIDKTFPGGVQANRDITLRVEEGEVHGLLGENGAGKSTLMNILYGLLTKDSGRIVIKGEEVELQSPQDAIVRGVGMVHQHFKLIPTLSVTENVILGLEFAKGRLGQTPEGIHAEADGPSRLGSIVRGFGSKVLRLGKGLMRIDFESAEEKIRRISEENGLLVDPEALVGDLSVGIQQRVEIIKTLYRDADILILDEPTSVLTPHEVDELFETLEAFRNSGRTIILITHKLREPMALCDRITVLRDGQLVGTVNKDDTSPEELAKMMVGRPVVFRVEKAPLSMGEPVLSIGDLKVADSRGLTKVRGVSFEVHSGEIFGIAGVEGNGQTELVEAISGLLKPLGGHVSVLGHDITGEDPRGVRDAGVSHIPEDRQRRGLVLGYNVGENIILGKHYVTRFTTGPGHLLINRDSVLETSRRLVDEFSIKVGGPKSEVRTMSGGNQQKLIVARELAFDPKLVIAAQPTRGLDVGATEYIHKVLLSMREAGVALLLVTADLDEVWSLADRIGVIFDGRIVAVKTPDQTSIEELGLLMAGHSERSPSQGVSD